MQSKSSLSKSGNAPLSLGQTVVRGWAWLTGQSFLGRLVQLVGQIILAKLLSPEDFGRVGLAMSVAVFATALINFGLDEVLVQRTRKITVWSAPVFWFANGLGVVGSAVMLMSIPVADSLYRDYELGELIAVLAVAPPLVALSVVPFAVARASLRFRFLAVLNFFEVLGLQLLTVLFAAVGFGALSFVIPVPVVAATRTLILWLATFPRLGNPVSMARSSRLLGRGLANYGTKIINAVTGQGDYIVLGIIAPASLVGAYVFAFSLSVLPVRMLAGSVTSVLLPALSRLKQDPKGQVAAAVNAARLLGFVVVPMCFLQAALAEPVLRLFFGEKWVSAAALVQILSIGLSTDVIAWVGGALLQSRGEFRTMFRISLVALAGFVVCVSGGAIGGSVASVAIGVAAYYLLLSPLWLIVGARLVGLPLLEVAKLYAYPFLAAAAAVGAAYWITHHSPAAENGPLVEICATLLLSALAYALLLWTLLPAYIRTSIAQVRPMFERGA